MADNYDGTEVELTLTAKIRYKVRQDSYGGAETLEEAMKIDVINAETDPVGVLSMEETLDTGAVTYEVGWRKV